MIKRQKTMPKMSKNNSMMISVNMLGIQMDDKLNSGFHRRSIYKYAVN